MRKQSALLAEAADKLESAMQLGETPVVALSPAKKPTLEAIKEYLGDGRNARTYELANHFKCDAEEISRIVNEPDSGLRVAHRGWIKPIL